MEYKNLLKASKSPAIQPVIEGLAVEANGLLLTYEQANAIEEELAAGAAAATQAEALSTQVAGLTEALATASEQAAQLAAVQQQLQQQTEALQLAEADLATAQQNLAAAQQTATGHEQTIANLQQQVQQLEQGTEPPAGTRRAADPAGSGKPRKKDSFDRYAESVLGPA